MIYFTSSIWQLKDQEAVDKHIQKQVLFPALTSLNFDKNLIESLPAHIKEMKALRVLSLNQNSKLKEVGIVQHDFL